MNRTQLLLTLAYTFTDYRAQGQTLEPMIVDIGLPHGLLTPFNIYVALSRGSHQENPKLLIFYLFFLNPLISKLSKIRKKKENDWAYFA